MCFELTLHSNTFSSTMHADYVLISHVRITLPYICLQHDMAILTSNWKLCGRPTYLIMVTEAMLQSPNVKDLIDLLASFKYGVVSEIGCKVKLDRLQVCVELITTVINLWSGLKPPHPGGQLCEHDLFQYLLDIKLPFPSELESWSLRAYLPHN